MPQKAKTHKTRTDNEVRRFRSSVRWKKFRAWVLSGNPLCQGLCARTGIVKAAEELHHIQPLRLRMDLALDESNVLSLCSSCHRRIEGTK